MTLPTYSTGTVSVSDGGTVVTGVGTVWSGISVVAGDMIAIDGAAAVLITNVTDVTHLSIPEWSGGDKSAVTYVIYQISSLRFDDVQIALDLQKQVQALNTEGFYIFVPSLATEPDPSLGDDGQYAFQAVSGKLWFKEGGIWSFLGVYKGFNFLGAYDSGTAYTVNDVITSGGSSYLVTAPTTGHAPPNASYYAVLALKGDQGIQGIQGASYGGTSTTSLVIGTGSKAFTTQAGLAYTNGARVRASSAANTSNWMEGLVTYSGTTLTMTSDKTNGSGTLADWNLNNVGQPGAGDLSSANNLSDLASATTALTNLGGTTVGKALFTATDAAAVKTTLGIFATTTPPQGRLTLTSGTPVMATSVTAATTIYYAPASGIYVPINVSGTMALYPFTASANDAVGLSVALGANWAASSNYDWFVIRDSGTIRLGSGPDWSAGAVAGSNTIGASSRGTGAGSTELQMFKGFLTNKNAITIRYANGSTVSVAANEATYVGTTRTGSAGQISFTYGSNSSGGGTANLYVWNAYNQVPITTTVSDSTSSWTYASATIRAANNGSTRVNFITGAANGGIDASYGQLIRAPAVAAAAGVIGVGLNSITTMDRTAQSGNNNATNFLDSQPVARNAYLPQLGANYISANESSDNVPNTITFFGAARHGLTVTLAM